MRRMHLLNGPRVLIRKLVIERRIIMIKAKTLRLGRLGAKVAVAKPSQIST